MPGEHKISLELDRGSEAASILPKNLPYFCSFFSELLSRRATVLQFWHLFSPFRWFRREKKKAGPAFILLRPECEALSEWKATVQWTYRLNSRLLFYFIFKTVLLPSDLESERRSIESPPPRTRMHMNAHYHRSSLCGSTNTRHPSPYNPPKHWQNFRRSSEYFVI